MATWSTRATPAALAALPADPHLQVTVNLPPPESLHCKRVMLLHAYATFRHPPGPVACTILHQESWLKGSALVTNGGCALSTGMRPQMYQQGGPPPPYPGGMPPPGMIPPGQQIGPLQVRCKHEI